MLHLQCVCNRARIIVKLDGMLFTISWIYRECIFWQIYGRNVHIHTYTKLYKCVHTFHMVAVWFIFFRAHVLRDVRYSICFTQFDIQWYICSVGNVTRALQIRYVAFWHCITSIYRRRCFGEYQHYKIMGTCMLGIAKLVYRKYREKKKIQKNRNSKLYLYFQTLHVPDTYFTSIDNHIKRSALILIRCSLYNICCINYWIAPHDTATAEDDPMPLNIGVWFGPEIGGDIFYGEYRVHA